MKTDSIKLELIQWLSSINDKEVLQSLFFYKKIQQKTDWWDELTEEQLEEINKGIADIKQGRTISSKEIWKKYGRVSKH